MNYVYGIFKHSSKPVLAPEYIGCTMFPAARFREHKRPYTKVGKWLKLNPAAKLKIISEWKGLKTARKVESHLIRACCPALNTFLKPKDKPSGLRVFNVKSLRDPVEIPRDISRPKIFKVRVTPDLYRDLITLRDKLPGDLHLYQVVEMVLIEGVKILNEKLK